MDLCGNMRPSVDIMDGLAQKIVMSDSSTLARILAYVAEMKIRAALEDESQQKVDVKATTVETIEALEFG